MGLLAYEPPFVVNQLQLYKRSSKTHFIISSAYGHATKRVVVPPPRPPLRRKSLSQTQLLEAVLLLVSAQRVNKTWHHTVAASPGAASRFMFFRAVPAEEEARAAGPC
ncbi:hypothetical protein PG993_013566 [Apiospora rasikravindrae]|uniref:Uncharacterized protein n=1 Tax=Apiospora rasikravindrae TaxID=990691 RepID=A0ABR1RXZ7_9PEZI